MNESEVMKWIRRTSKYDAFKWVNEDNFENSCTDSIYSWCEEDECQYSIIWSTVWQECCHLQIAPSYSHKLWNIHLWIDLCIVQIDIYSINLFKASHPIVTTKTMFDLFLFLGSYFVALHVQPFCPYHFVLCSCMSELHLLLPFVHTICFFLCVFVSWFKNLLLFLFLLLLFFVQKPLLSHDIYQHDLHLPRFTSIITI